MLETERTVLRPWTESDASDFLPVFGDHDAMRFWNTPLLATEDKVRAMIRRSRTASPKHHRAFAVVLKATGHAIGLVNYHHREPTNRRLEIGFITAPRFHRQGYTQEAVSALLSHCFTSLNTHRVEALTDPQNAGSRALLERIGFKQEGEPLRQRIILGSGTFGDQIVYSRLATDNGHGAIATPTQASA